MIVLSWNCRGLRNPHTVHDVRWMVKVKRPNLVFLMETKLRQNKMEGIRMKLGFGNMFVVDCVGWSGGLVLFWEDGSGVEIQNFSHQHINAIVSNQNHSMEWKFTGFYGHPEASKRNEVWDLLKYLAQICPKPWMCIGDFNEVMTMSEKRGANVRPRGLMQAFQHTLEECEMADLGYCGPKFTWSNCQEGVGLIKERLDRVLANHEWRSLFPDAVNHVSVTTNSDHAPLFLHLLHSQSTGRKKAKFRYESCWAALAGCKDAIDSAWSKQYTQGG
ncbi:uncharacterized protein LOC132181612 [Corylus avellana]|uniref:uncharacterized protein LOC132181612 n=1 Tax=Corylus avellana TaxID=13451 RepID=UPI00286D35C0|nr:uncharacterized protein LOC132181612 [Corylus avellana]